MPRMEWTWGAIRLVSGPSPQPRSRILSAMSELGLWYELVIGVREGRKRYRKVEDRARRGF